MLSMCATDHDYVAVKGHVHELDTLRIGLRSISLWVKITFMLV